LLSREETPTAGASGCRERVNRAIDHVLEHLDRPLRLAEVASVAELSPFHFHRLFRSLVGEPLGRFVRRLRLERALHRMAHAPERSLTEIALESGFASSSDFSRSFKQHYGVAPRDFDLAGWRDSRRGELEGSMQAEGHRPGPRLGPGDNPDGFRVELVDLPPRTAAGAYAVTQGQSRPSPM
jgi:AraC family transcriptional regulator